jgi:sulfatase modifying factor 1
LDIVRSIGLGICLCLAAAVVSAADRPGLVATKPEKQPYVETAQGFMVPYQQTIPGTDVSFTMTPIPGGKYLMGSPDSEKGHNADESPQIEITVPPMWIATHEATWAEYRPFMELFATFKNFESVGVRKVTDENRADAITVPTPLYEPTFTFEFGDDPMLPAVSMTQYAAKQYTKWISKMTGLQYRLPLESEWEYACRAGSKTAYCFGDDASQLAEYAHFDATSKDTGPRKVGLGQASIWGLYDIHGNVSEWCLDEYFEDGYAALKGKTDLTPDKAYITPEREWPRVCRGGNWASTAEECRSAARLPSDPQWRTTDPNLPKSPWWMTDDPARGVGVRLVRPLEEAPPALIAKYWDMDLEQTKTDVGFRMIQGRGVWGLVDPELPKAMKSVQEMK